MIGTSVVTITASDADDQTYGNSAKLVYSILEGQPYFSVDSENGETVSERQLQHSGSVKGKKSIVFVPKSKFCCFHLEKKKTNS